LHNEIAEDLATAGLPVTHEVLGRPSELIDAMRQDKKAIGGSLAFSLVHRLGECKLYTDIREADVRYALGQV
jgi:3-dehydroquinate synthetase